MTPVTVTVTYTKDGVTLARLVGLANQDLLYEAQPAPLVLADDEYGTETWYGFKLTNYVTHHEKQASA